MKIPTKEEPMQEGNKDETPKDDPMDEFLAYRKNIISGLAKDHREIAKRVESVDRKWEFLDAKIFKAIDQGGFSRGEVAEGLGVTSGPVYWMIQTGSREDGL